MMDAQEALRRTLLRIEEIKQNNAEAARMAKELADKKEQERLFKFEADIRDTHLPLAEKEINGAINKGDRAVMLGFNEGNIVEAVVTALRALNFHVAKHYKTGESFDIRVCW